ncbi:hypothetical protein DPMN_181735 [Dreissena polymorpha]|uniref:Uncharacterized protein n=1 Tax=Dreissena polymorpha TaxID=45954 RepID=A0A9D4I3Z0_DREPO|nr:hypothetical protein DPMN_181735 [Dreissena polymorpha]
MCEASSVTSMLDHLQRETLESRRTNAQLSIIYKISNNLIDIPAAKYLSSGSSSTRSSHAIKFQPISTLTSYYRRHE